MFDLLQMEGFPAGHSAVPNYDGDKELDAPVPKGKQHGEPCQFSSLKDFVSVLVLILKRYIIVLRVL